MVEDGGRIDAHATVLDLEVQVLGGGPPRAPRESDDVSGLDLVSYLDQVLVLVGVERLKTESVADDDAVAIAREGGGAGDDAVESSHDVVFGLGLEVYATVAPSAAIGADDLGTQERVGPVLLLYLGKVELEAAAVFKRVGFLVGVEGQSALLVALSVDVGYTDIGAALLERQHLTVESVVAGIDDGGGVDA